MAPEVVGAFRLAIKHEELAGYLRWRSRRSMRPLAQKHHSKAQKLYERARRLEEKTKKRGTDGAQ